MLNVFKLMKTGSIHPGKRFLTARSAASFSPAHFSTVVDQSLGEILK